MLDAGDEAVVIGRQGRERILARELAEKAGTISWDIFRRNRGTSAKILFRERSFGKGNSVIENKLPEPL